MATLDARVAVVLSLWVRTTVELRMIGCWAVSSTKFARRTQKLKSLSEFGTTLPDGVVPPAHGRIESFIPHNIKNETGWMTEKLGTGIPAGRVHSCPSTDAAAAMRSLALRATLN